MFSTTRATIPDSPEDLEHVRPLDDVAVGRGRVATSCFSAVLGLCLASLTMAAEVDGGSVFAPNSAEKA